MTAAPLHARVRDELRRRIVGGELAADGRLPPERSLCAELGVSRVTVRRALAALAADGLVEAVQGRGTFATTGRLAEPPNVLLSFTDLAASRGLLAGSQVLSTEVRPATISEAEALGLAPGSALFALRRLRVLDGLPVAVDGSVVPLALEPALPGLDWTRASLYAALAGAGHGPVRADYAVEAQGAEAHEARLLGLAAGAPVLVAESLAVAATERVVALGRIVYRGDRYRFRSTLTAQPSRPPGSPQP